jgi:hypothetical protein
MEPSRWWNRGCVDDSGDDYLLSRRGQAQDCLNATVGTASFDTGVFGGAKHLNCQICALDSGRSMLPGGRSATAKYLHSMSARPG